MKNNAKKIGILLFSTAFSLFLYTFLHELGHLLIMLYAGDTITEFSIITAHVSGYGGNYTDFTDILLHAGGMLLPVIICLALMLTYRKNAKKFLHLLFIHILRYRYMYPSCVGCFSNYLHV